MALAFSLPMPESRPQRGLLARLNAGVFDLPAEDLVGITAWLDVSRCLTAAVLIVLTVALRASVLPDLPVLPLVAIAAFEILVTFAYRRWIASRRWLGALIYVQFMVDLVCFTGGLRLAPALPNEFHFLYLLMIVPCALFSLLCGLVMATLATAAHLWLTPQLDWSMPVVMPVVVFFLVAQHSRFYGERLVAKSSQAEGAARVAEALLRVVRALTTAATSDSLLQRVTEVAREVLGSTWACVIVRNPSNGKVRVMGLASRTGVLDEEIRSVEFRAPGVDAALARLAPDTCLEVRSPEESPIPGTLSDRWTIGPFLGAALRRGDEALGLLLVGQDDPATAFEASAKQLTVGIAHQTVLALDNARLVDELRAASTLKSEFIGTMSHELRSPLNAIIGYTELLRDEERDAADPQAAERDRTLARVRYYAVQLLEMIQATLDISRLEAGRLPVHAVPVDLDALVAELRTGIPEYWMKPEVALEWSVPAHLPGVEVDGPKLATIVRNLVHNALKFTERGKVTVYAHVDVASTDDPDAATDQLVVTVTDTGIGIPEDQLGVVFEMFRQVDGSDSRRHGGVGLGLYIVMRLAQALGGTITVNSVPDHGSTFAVAVPVRVGAVERHARAAVG